MSSWIKTWTSRVMTGEARKGKAEDEGEHVEAKRQDGMIASCLREEEVTRRNIHEHLTTRWRYYLGSADESDDKDANMATNVPIEEDYEQELAEALDDIDGQELDP